MKQRVVTSLVLIAGLSIVLAFFGTYLFNGVVAVICVIAVMELLNATGTAKYRDFVFFAVISCLLFPFAYETVFWKRLPQIVYVLYLLFFLLVLKNHGKVRFEQASMIFLFSILIPLCFSCAVYMRGQFGDICGRYYLLLALAAAWLCDTGAYFSGMLFGRHKLAPVISPKKTVEGSVGGAIIAIALILPLSWVYGLIAGTFGFSVRIDYLRLAAVTPLLSVIGMLGDLSMSVIKRQFGVKDYGTLFPGHGGVLDRFDSVLFTLPSVYILIQYLPAISLP